ncbi:MAG: DNA polymerase III subunit gamma/tau [Nitrospinota bacterium]|nr:DNA polymerase III subunit gamma/tau [Nitrospinota bacterium]
MADKFTVTARKFRPMTFSQMVGQRHIVRALTNALEKKRIGHAYLFSGTRGVGKTTTARILAKSLNCKSGPTSEPCLECDNCMEITAGNAMDVMEIDGASNRGIDSIRELRERIMFTPSKSRYKVYIIDEVHQITKEAFNALLKTLEEPPEFVVFIFATTEQGKVPETILSRCQSYEFKALSMKEIADHLSLIAEKEGIKASLSAVELIARRARGSMRDAQSMFDQAEAYGAGEVGDEEVKTALGLVDNATMSTLMDAVTARDMGGLMTAASAVSASGADPAAFLEDVAALVRDIMAARLTPGSMSGREEKEKAKLTEWATTLEYDELQRFFNVLSDTMRNMKYSAQPHLTMEMGLLRLGEKRGVASLDEAIAEVTRAQARAEKEEVEEPFRFPMSGAPAIEQETNLAPAPENIQMAVSGAGAGPEALLEAFKEARPMLLGIMDNATAQMKGEVVVIKVTDMHSLEQLEDPDLKATLQEVARKLVCPTARVVVEYHGVKKNCDDGGARRLEERERSLKKQMVDSPIINEAMEIFSNMEVVDVQPIKGA